jgi:dihydroflavonol-4-reductase
LRAALDGGVERVVLTSSIAAIRGSRASSATSPYTEADWTDGNDASRTPYVRSKTLAERAAWDLVQDAGATERLATVNPGAIIGPTLNQDHSYSLQAIKRLLTGMPAAPRIGFTFVDVSDVADLHIRAMADPAAGGERFIATDRWLWTADVAAILRERLGDAASKVPTRVAPDLLVRGFRQQPECRRRLLEQWGGALGRRRRSRPVRAALARPLAASVAASACGLAACPPAHG